MLLVPHREIAVRNMTIQDTRRRNLKALIREWGGPSTLAKKLLHAGPSYLSQLISGNRPLTEKTARGIEEKLDLPAGWLDEDQHGAGTGQVDARLLAEVIALVNETRVEMGGTISKDKMGELVSLAYENAQSNGGRVDERFVVRIVKLAIKE